MSLTSQIRYLVAVDSTTGARKTGLVHTDFTAKYLTIGGTLLSLTPQTITTLGTYEAPTSNSNIRIKELNSADPTKGVYEVHFHNDHLDADGKMLWLFLSATGTDVAPLQVELVPYATLDGDSAAAFLSMLDGTGGATLSLLSLAISGNMTVGGGLSVTDDFIVGGGVSVGGNFGVIGDFTTNNVIEVDATKIFHDANAAFAAATFWSGALLNYGTAQGGAAGYIDLEATANSTDDFYNGSVVTITGGTGVGQSRQITDYTGSSRRATVVANWVTATDNTSTYVVLGRIV